MWMSCPQTRVSRVTWDVPGFWVPKVELWYPVVEWCACLKPTPPVLPQRFAKPPEPCEFPLLIRANLIEKSNLLCWKLLARLAWHRSCTWRDLQMRWFIELDEQWNLVTCVFPGTSRNLDLEGASYVAPKSSLLALQPVKLFSKSY